MRTCKSCGKEKELEKFVKGAGDLYRYMCKDCRNSKRRTGKPNTGRFQKGQKSKGKIFTNGHIPWHKGLKHAWKKTEDLSQSVYGKKCRDWKESVKNRDNQKCQKCGSTDRIAAHHIVPWKDDIDKRFDIGNGITLCCSCHAKEEGFKEGHKSWNKGSHGLMPVPWNKGKKTSPEVIEKTRKLFVGRMSPMKGKKHSDETKRKMSLAKIGKPSNRLKNKEKGQ